MDTATRLDAIAWFAGVGCVRDCPAHALRALVATACAEADIALGGIRALGTIAAKCDEPALYTVAAELGVTLQIWTAAELRPFDEALTVRSPRALAATGCAGVAEAAALACARAAGPAHGFQLALARRSNGRATVALAISDTRANTRTNTGADARL